MISYYCFCGKLVYQIEDKKKTDTSYWASCQECEDADKAHIELMARHMIDRERVEQLKAHVRAKRDKK